ncbi:MAG: hypothetical protein U0X86_000285 [Wolbachia endosymbiont of Xenopsylla cheopis]
MNNHVLSSVLKRYKKLLILGGIMLTSTVFTGVSLFSKLGKTSFALGVTGFISLVAFCLFAMAITVYSASDDIKKYNKISEQTIKKAATFTTPLLLGTMLTGIGLFGNELDSNVKFIAGIVGFVALSFLALLTAVNCAKEIKQKYELKLEDANYKNGVKDQKQHAA